MFSVSAVCASEISVTDSYATSLVDDTSDVSVYSYAASSDISVSSDSNVGNDSSKVSLSSEEVLESDDSNTLSTNTDSNKLTSYEQNVVEATFDDDEIGASNGKVDVYFVAPDRTLHVEEIDNGYSYPVILRDVDGNGLANKPVTLTFNGQTQTLKTNSRGWVYFNISAQKTGCYSVDLKFAGDNNYKSLLSSAFKTIDVIKWDASFVAPNKKFNVDEIDDGYSYGLTLRDSEGTALAGKKVTATFNGETQTKTTNANGRAYFNLSAGAGSYSLKIKFAGDRYYNALSDVRTITVIGNNVSFVAPNKKFKSDEIYDGYSYGLTLRDSDGNALAGKKVTVTFNGKSQTKTTNTNGRAYFNLSVNKAGSHSLSIKFAGDRYYNALSEVRTITVIGNNVSFVAPNKKFNVNEVYDGYTYGMTLRDSDGNALAGKKITFTFNGKTQTKTTNANGRAYFNLTSGAGVYQLGIDFAGDEYYNPLSEVRTITVIGCNVTFVAPNKKLYEDEIDKYYTYGLTLRDSDGNALAGKKVTVTFKDKTQTKTTNANGRAYFNLTSGKYGSYPLSIDFAGDDYYNPLSEVRNITVVKRNVTLNTEQNTFNLDDISAGVTYPVILRDSDGNPLDNKNITITFNGKNYVGITDSKGYCYFNLTVDKAGSHHITIKFDGTKYYYSKSLSKTIKVLGYDTKISWKGETSFTGASQTIKVLLADSKNAALSGKTVKLTVNSKTYSAKTDSNGYATFNLNLGSNTYSASYMFEGDDKYKASSGSTKITVKSYSVSINNILAASVTVKNYYANNKKLPNSVTIAGNSYTMPEFLYLMSQAIYQLGKSNSNSITAIMGVKSPSSPSGDDISSAKLYKADYLSMAKTVADYIKSNNKAPNYVSSDVGKIHYIELVEASARILDFYKNNDKYMPNYVTISYGTYSYSGSMNVKNTIKDLTAYYQSSKNCQVNNAQIKAIVNSLTKGISDDEQKAIAIFNYVRDKVSYSYYYNTKYGAVGTLNAKTGNCVDQAHLLVAMFRTAGLAARYEHGTCYFTLSGSTYGHVWAQVLIGNT